VNGTYSGAPSQSFSGTQDSSSFGYFAADSQSLGGLLDANGSFLEFIPLQVADTNYSDIQVTANNFITYAPLASETVDLSALTNSAPMSVATLGAGPATGPTPYDGTYNGTFTVGYSYQEENQQTGAVTTTSGTVSTTMTLVLSSAGSLVEPVTLSDGTSAYVLAITSVTSPVSGYGCTGGCQLALGTAWATFPAPPGTSSNANDDFGIDVIFPGGGQFLAQGSLFVSSDGGVISGSVGASGICLGDTDYGCSAWDGIDNNMNWLIWNDLVNAPSDSDNWTITASSWTLVRQ
jgi:hypothetical protein